MWKSSAESLPIPTPSSAGTATSGILYNVYIVVTVTHSVLPQDLEELSQILVYTYSVLCSKKQLRYSVVASLSPYIEELSQSPNDTNSLLCRKKTPQV
jgi:hypothetical protein